MIVATFVQFVGKEVSCYLEAYEAKMFMRDILEARWLSNFARVVTPSLSRDKEELDGLG